jgi:hypothetical protein
MLHALGGLSGLQGSLLRSLQSGLLRGKVHLAPLLIARGFNAQRFGFLASPGPLLLDGLLNALAGFLASLCPGRREVTILGAVQIRPGVQRSNVLRRIGWIGLRFALRHSLFVRAIAAIARLPKSPVERHSLAEDREMRSDAGCPHRQS